MKFQSELIIDKNLGFVVDKFIDINHKVHYTPGVKEIEEIGKWGEVDSVAKITYNINGKMYVVDEKVIHSDLPNYIKISSDLMGMKYTYTNYFEPIDGKTKWKQVAEYNSNWVVKILTRLRKKAFQKELNANMSTFADYINTI